MNALLISALLIASAFQPGPPYYAAFFYPWYPDWSDRGHQPPDNWFSNYLPDPDPCVFDPASELYTSTNDKIIYWQLRKMAEARLAVAIASWWGRGHKTDRAMQYILTDVMNREDNPYPNLRWALYYEKESLGDPTVAELVDDLTYIKLNYASQPGYLKIDGKPVIFVYAGGNDGPGMAARWSAARAQTGFYVVLKVYAGYRGDPNQPDSWHQYAPANRVDRQLPYSWMVSPGFWLDGEAVRLPRDLGAFRQAVAEMVAAPVTWKLIETWNEWGEGTSVEPGEQVIQTKSGKATPDPNGAPFKNLYVEALGELLSPLEQGTGADRESRVDSVKNAASLQSGPISPGEIITIFGAGLGSGARVFIDCEVAPLLYASREQMNAIVPYAVAARASAQLEIEYQGSRTATLTLPVAPASPAIFPRAILNEDGSPNSLANAAAAGSTIVLFVTGVGRTDTAGRPLLPVFVEIGGIAADVSYDPVAAGVLQLNARIPRESAAGDAVPVSLKVGDYSSPGGVTVSLR